MSVARRPLLTATAAGTLLCALWFVPSAKATDDMSGATGGREQSAPSEQSQGRLALEGYEEPATPSTPSAPATSGEDRREPVLADTGSVDTTPYVVGGTGCLGIGAGFVAYSMRRAGRTV
ncbi:hypothetical protein [Streptomyces corynorhini]|uniref:Tat pathway signal sequence domain protein n=1 Tax=Streptomyces corynorhini TaxID=2282652 RepID=A0A370B5F4_9ACTN|nr:hypothetical protein [Streptomyces corynorhini]RDG36811.1 hypothetical protein DVH02_17975 [Streptomyces corynorhini]